MKTNTWQLVARSCSVRRAWSFLKVGWSWVTSFTSHSERRRCNWSRSGWCQFLVGSSREWAHVSSKTCCMKLLRCGLLWRWSNHRGQFICTVVILWFIESMCSNSCLRLVRVSSLAIINWMAGKPILINGDFLIVPGSMRFLNLNMSVQTVTYTRHQIVLLGWLLVIGVHRGTWLSWSFTSSNAHSSLHRVVCLVGQRHCSWGIKYLVGDIFPEGSVQRIALVHMHTVLRIVLSLFVLRTAWLLILHSHHHGNWALVWTNMLLPNSDQGACSLLGWVCCLMKVNTLVNMWLTLLSRSTST